MPIEYAGTLSEHRAVRERVGLFDLSHLGKVDVTGPGALDALQGLLTNDLRKVEVGGSQYHHLLNERGGVEEDLFVYRLGEERWFVVPNASNKDKVVAAFRDAAGADAVTDHDDWCFLAVQGPRSHAVVSTLWPDAVELPFRGCRSVRRGEAEVVLARTGYTGERGYELFADGSLAGELWDALIAGPGRRRGSSPRGLGARDVLRLEMGYPLYGQDLGPDRTTLEAGPVVGGLVRQGRVRGTRRARAPAGGGAPEPAPRSRHRRSPAHPSSASAVCSRATVRSARSRAGRSRPLLGVGIAIAYLSPAERVRAGSARSRSTSAAGAPRHAS